jgi:hypothetical protein
MEGWRPAQSIAIDPGPYSAVVVCWAGRCVTILVGSGTDTAKTASADPPVIFVPTIPIGPPVTSLIRAPMTDALAEEPPEVGRALEIPEGHDGRDVDLRQQSYAALPTDNERTIVVPVAGNLIHLDQYKGILADAERDGVPVLFRLVESERVTS